MKNKFVIFIFILIWALGGCSSLPMPEGMSFETYETKDFNIATWTKQNIKQKSKLKVYIEGDGLAWLTPTRPSMDPTPKNQLVLTWASNDPGNTVYMARPCQFVFTEDKCYSNYWWTNGRFSPEVINAMDFTFSKVLEKYNPESVELVAYSGGATVAIILASKHLDVVKSLITIEGVIDHAKWTSWHDDTPLTGSLNAADYLNKISGIKQLHIIGGKDTTVPLKLAKTWVDNKKILVVKNAKHGKNLPKPY
ncbi:MAG: hypothetical protein MJ247_00470 [Alphaproteobacteria bacterium]|nr:hypothetical protein [Alphaproteobacteria bacterium]